ncbi:uncharacterized protein BT62DRAFT_42228 [Guyanagaster necrorhizus]|uniref:Uncharacterized protein n=1 Tax=Guyanagaster necrorhizus TaxID=856835 RepID=A0A9P7W418_9AGAR|nr:uncharacterized protein BT62DRAFT_42228 [Guyanagaster necrorhizus MCA 3950]KAG7453016.1 hypothetical protein BT62DRAFT_42228 [Guyanagaster necrorhizus MCA 3950]
MSPVTASTSDSGGVTPAGEHTTASISTTNTTESQFPFLPSTTESKNMPRPQVRIADKKADVFLYRSRRASPRRVERKCSCCKHRGRCSCKCCCRKRKKHHYEKDLTRDFFLIIALCFVAACFLICFIRPVAFSQVLESYF